MIIETSLLVFAVSGLCGSVYSSPSFPSKRETSSGPAARGEQLCDEGYFNLNSRARLSFRRDAFARSHSERTSQIHCIDCGASGIPEEVHCFNTDLTWNSDSAWTCEAEFPDEKSRVETSLIECVSAFRGIFELRKCVQQDSCVVSLSPRGRSRDTGKKGLIPIIVLALGLIGIVAVLVLYLRVKESRSVSPITVRSQSQMEAPRTEFTRAHELNLMRESDSITPSAPPDYDAPPAYESCVKSFLS
ncbi:uncharacterized protein LOC100897788 [Galendromus occidentalis]|uniref:Uncharacterized protein LOC100897788 n=1 Tax=Galendromus occidentalis TaxID=34638 RepID=A0AAJ6QWZ5_9ACAR|nr:uncharacterized protein LOC100897788 [Galendromus occidentalis]